MKGFVRDARKWNPAIWVGMSLMLSVVARSSDNGVLAFVAYAVLCAFVGLAVIVTITPDPETPKEGKPHD